MDKASILFVDLDNTLTRSDLFLEPLLRLLRKDPMVLFLLPLWLMHGRGYVKQQLSERVKFDVADIPYDEDVLEFISAQKAIGRKIVLATASNQTFAERVTSYLGCFDDVIASSLDLNVKGKNKLAAMKRYAGDQPFDYLGDSHADIPIWKAIGKALVVSPQLGVLKRLERNSIPAQLVKPSPDVEFYVKAIRPWQWLKNGLIFVPLVLAKQMFDPMSLFISMIAFISFSLIASAGYIGNDLLDLEVDRLHPRKKNRPIAAGQLSVWNMVFLSVGLLFTGLLLALSISFSFCALLLGYFVIVMAYSLELKQHAMLDVILIAGFYATRIIAGGLATEIEISFWLLAYSIFVFLSLALVKRCTEIRNSTSEMAKNIPGRGYNKEDEPILASMGITSGYISVVVIALYLHSDEVAALYNSPQTLWFVCPLMLYWISRVWLKTRRNEMDDDPLIFALRDKVSLITGILLALVMLLATV